MFDPRSQTEYKTVLRSFDLGVDKLIKPVELIVTDARPLEVTPKGVVIFMEKTDTEQRSVLSFKAVVFEEECPENWQYLGFVAHLGAIYWRIG